MTPKQIQKTLKERKVTQKALARKLGISEMGVSRVINRLNVSNRVMTAVAGAIGKPKEQVFPEYYLGPRKRRTSKAMGTNKA